MRLYRFARLTWKKRLSLRSRLVRFLPRFILEPLISPSSSRREAGRGRHRTFACLEALGPVKKVVDGLGRRIRRDRRHWRRRRGFVAKVLGDGAHLGSREVKFCDGTAGRRRGFRRRRDRRQRHGRSPRTVVAAASALEVRPAHGPDPAARALDRRRRWPRRSRRGGRPRRGLAPGPGRRLAPRTGGKMDPSPKALRSSELRGFAAIAPIAPRASAAAPVAAAVPARTVFAGARRQPWTRARPSGVAPESPAARDSRRWSRGGMSLSRTPVVASARPVLGGSLGPRAPGRERPRRRAAPRGERRREGVLEVGETKRLCGVCRCVFPGGRSLEGSVDGARVPRRKVAAPPRTSSRRSDVSTCGGGLTGRTTGAGRRGAARGFQERPGSGGGPGSATGASASRTFAALSAGSSPLTSSSARRRRSNSSATWVSGPRVA